MLTPTDREGQQIADALDVEYSGIELLTGEGYLFRDPETGSTFYGSSYASAAERLRVVRRDFAVVLG